MSKNEDSIASKRSSLKSYYTEKWTFLRTLSIISKKSILFPDHKFDNLFRLICDPNLLTQAMGNLRTKKGALTPGPSSDRTTIDASSLNTIFNLSKSLKDGSFRFKPIRRIFIDKTGKNPNIDKVIQKLYNKKLLTPEKIKELKVRPLGIPSFTDKIVQEALRMILNAIYEPEFEIINSNFGFRPGKGVHDAQRSIQSYAKSMTFAIEADIQGAFDNVDFDILINILKKKIQDTKLLKLILYGLKCGINYSEQFEETKIGTTQGSIVSPLLYNIYFHEFDKYIKNEFTQLVNNINNNEKRVERPFNPFYNKTRKTKYTFKYPSILKTLKQSYTPEKANSNEFISLHKEFKIAQKEHFKLDKLQKNITPYAKSRQTIRFHYVRYADDWIFFTNASLERTNQFKEIFTDWITNHLKLTLSPTKTLITSFFKAGKVHFLGFQLCYYQNKRILKIGNVRKLKLNPTNRRIVTSIPTFSNRTTFTQRTTNPTLIATWDRTRVLTRLEKTKFIRKHNGEWIGSRKPEWGVLAVPEIIERYNYVIRGYLNFYAPIISYSNDVSQLHYLLRYSCLHTLSQKLNLTIRGILKKFGKDITINWEIKTNNKKNIVKSMTSSLITWKQSQEIINQSITNFRNKIRKKLPFTTENLIQKSVDDIANVKVNWRTAYKLSQHCCICGSENKIEYHHVKHIRKGKVTGFLQVLKQLNRKQIPTCLPCHKKIHNGTYDGLKLVDLFDAELMIL
jgi:retron-type reverse transcriptase